MLLRLLYFSAVCLCFIEIQRICARKEEDASKVVALYGAPTRHYLVRFLREQQQYGSERRGRQKVGSCYMEAPLRGRALHPHGDVPATAAGALFRARLVWLGDQRSVTLV